jgi:hypothetical protein
VKSGSRGLHSGRRGLRSGARDLVHRQWELNSCRYLATAADRAYPRSQHQLRNRPSRTVSPDSRISPEVIPSRQFLISNIEYITQKIPGPFVPSSPTSTYRAADVFPSEQSHPHCARSEVERSRGQRSLVGRSEVRGHSQEVRGQCGRWQGGDGK